MSVINQVLNQLEQRGAHNAPEQTMVRAIPPIRRKPVVPLLVLGLMLAIGVAVWQWAQPRKETAPVVNAVRYQPAKMTVAPAPVVPVEGPLLTEMLLPASRLSFELSAVPLPSSLRESKDNAAPGRMEAPAANLIASAGQIPLQAAQGKDVPATRPAGEAASPLTPPTNPETKTATKSAGGASPMKQVSPVQRADAEFRRAVALMQQGRIADALAGYEAALHLDPGHDAARQALVALLLEGKRGADAERVLQDGLMIKPGQTGLAMLLARLQVERDAVELATETLEKTLVHAERQADYHAFFAALLQRQNRHKEAITHYQIALQLAPNNGIWLMGYSISLQAAQRIGDARDAFRRALESKALNPELQAFVQQKLKGLEKHD